jgi:hypothetical protein
MSLENIIDSYEAINFRLMNEKSVGVLLYTISEEGRMVHRVFYMKNEEIKLKRVKLIGISPGQTYYNISSGGSTVTTKHGYRIVRTSKKIEIGPFTANDSNYCAVRGDDCTHVDSTQFKVEFIGEEYLISTVAKISVRPITISSPHNGYRYEFMLCPTLDTRSLVRHSISHIYAVIDTMGFLHPIRSGSPKVIQVPDRYHYLPESTLFFSEVVKPISFKLDYIPKHNMPPSRNTYYAAGVMYLELPTGGIRDIMINNLVKITSVRSVAENVHHNLYSIFDSGNGRCILSKVDTSISMDTYSKQQKIDLYKSNHKEIITISTSLLISGLVHISKGKHSKLSNDESVKIGTSKVIVSGGKDNDIPLMALTLEINHEVTPLLESGKYDVCLLLAPMGGRNSSAVRPTVYVGSVSIKNNKFI